MLLLSSYNNFAVCSFQTIFYNTVEFGYNGFGYNVNSPITLHFSWSRQNSYLLCTFQFVYSGIAYNVNLAVTAPFFHPPDNFLCL